MSAINEWFGGYSAIFRYIERTYGEKELDNYLAYLAREAYSDVTPVYREGGLEAVQARYVKNFRMDGGEEAVSSRLEDGALTMEVRCPAFHNAPKERHPDRQCGGFFCRCCQTLNARILAEAGYGLDVSMERCGDCIWTVKRVDDNDT